MQLFGHSIATWYAMSRSLVKLTEIGTSWCLDSDPINTGNCIGERGAGHLSGKIRPPLLDI